MTRRFLQVLVVAALLALPAAAFARGVAVVSFRGATVSSLGLVSSLTPVTGTLVLTNTGDSALAISSTSIVAGSDPAFTRPSSGYTCGIRLAPGAACAIPVRFAPSTYDRTTGTLRIVSDSGGTPGTATDVALIGNPPQATAVTLTASPSNSVTIGTPTTWTATATGSDGLPADAYLYQFSTGPAGCTGPWTVVQAWSPKNVWKHPGNVRQNLCVHIEANAGWKPGLVGSTPT